MTFRVRDNDADNDGNDNDGTGINPGVKLGAAETRTNFLNIRPPTGDPRNSFDGSAFKLGL